MKAWWNHTHKLVEVAESYNDLIENCPDLDDDWAKIDLKYWTQLKIVWGWDAETPWYWAEEGIDDWIFNEWGDSQEIPLLPDEAPTVDSPTSWNITFDELSSSPKAMASKKPKAKAPYVYYSEGMPEEAIIPHLKATIDAFIKQHEISQQKIVKLNSITLNAQKEAFSMAEELNQLRNQVIDSQKLMARVKLLSKQLKIPFTNSGGSEQMLADFIGQAWCRIKTTEESDELAD